MEKIMLVGETGAGKSSLIRVLAGGGYAPRRAMAVEHYGRFINTPGEFLENSRFYHALITTAVDSAIIVFMQDATRATSVFPPHFVSMFNKKTVGVISKIDLPESRPARAQRFLESAGVKECIPWSASTGQGRESLERLFLL